jgi:hypothetical protein
LIGTGRFRCSNQLMATVRRFAVDPFLTIAIELRVTHLIDFAHTSGPSEAATDPMCHSGRVRCSRRAGCRHLRRHDELAQAGEYGRTR